jgi:hypothetical protein
MSAAEHSLHAPSTLLIGSCFACMTGCGAGERSNDDFLLHYVSRLAAWL